MKASTIAKKAAMRARPACEPAHQPPCEPAHGPAHEPARWLGLAAAPTFAAMALISATDISHAAMHAAVPGVLPIDGMSLMYALMSVFHASPWLELVSGHARELARSTPHPEGE